MAHTFIANPPKPSKHKPAYSFPKKAPFQRFRSFAVLLFLCFSIQALSAQDYTQALGLRFGSTKGLTYKNFVGESQAIEGMIVYHKEGFRGIGLFEQHFFLGRRSNTSLYLGVGGYAGVTALLDEFPGQTNVAGIVGILGFEYTFPHSNLVFAFDLNPAYELIQKSGLSGNQAAVSLRYVLD